jgi:DNA invertase Pin-like site-specific DNA recombinase
MKTAIAIYARISKDTSHLDNQLDLLREYCKTMNYEIVEEYKDIISGAAANRPEFSRMMADASKRRFSLLLFFALDRFSRAGTRETIHYLQMLDDYGVSYRSYSEQYIDSTGIFKDVVISLLATLAKQERLRISERVKLGLDRARKQGRIGGRPTLDAAKIIKIRELKSSGFTVVMIARELRISRGSVYQYL